MKKSLILLALPALLLSGCSKEISKEDAKKRAQEIVDHEVKLDDFKKVRVEITSEGTFEGDVNGSEKSTNVFEYSVEDNWVHSFTIGEQKQGDQTKKYESESWVYQEEGKYYIVSRDLNGETEKKGYYLFQESDGALLWTVEKEMFDSYFASIQLSALSNLDGKESLKQIISALDGQELSGITFDFKYYSTGEGNLTIEGKTVDTAYEHYGYKGEATATVKTAWDKYVVSENSSVEEGTLKNEEGKEVKMKDSSKVAFAYDVTVSKPDLSGYEQNTINL